MVSSCWDLVVVDQEVCQICLLSFQGYLPRAREHVLMYIVVRYIPSLGDRVFLGDSQNVACVQIYCQTTFDITSVIDAKNDYAGV